MPEYNIVSMTDPPHEESSAENSTEAADFTANMRTSRGHGENGVTMSRATTDGQAVIHLVKSSLGTGILAMPFAFSNAGLAGGLIGTAFVSLIYTYCVHIMVRSSQVLCERHNIPSLDFANLVDIAFQRGPERAQRFAGAMRLTHTGSFLSQATQDWLGEALNLRLGVAIVTPVLLVICMVRGMRHIAPFSLLSNCLILSAVGVILWFVFSEQLPSVTSRPAFASITSLPIFLSTATFAISGVTVVMPLENSMAHPEHFLGFGRVLTTAMTLIAATYSALGFFGYLKYGCLICSLAKSANVMLGIAVTLTYPLVLQCCVEFTWPGLSRRLGSFTRVSATTAERLYRACLVLFHSLVAALVPNLGALMSLSGALFTVAVAFLLPPALETVVWWENLSGHRLVLTTIKNAIIVLFGVTVAITGSVTSVRDIIEAFSPPANKVHT
ncbi:hypothetical protein B566_EDAN001933 [Ephemera danica]|nr:hypothetical protein B566_EDAN001933 [Ephemera danica]